MAVDLPFRGDAELLKLEQLEVALVGLAFFYKFYEVKEPLPHELRVLMKELVCQDLGRISNASVATGPEPVVAAEGGDSTGSAQASSGNNHDVLLAN